MLKFKYLSIVYQFKKGNKDIFKIDGGISNLDE